MLKQNKWTKIRISVITVWLWNIQDAIETSFMVRVNSYIQFGKNSKIPSLLSAKWLNSLTSVWSIKKCIYIAHLLKILNFKFCKVAFYASLFFHVFLSFFISQLSCKQKKLICAFVQFLKESLGAKVAMFNQYADKHKDKQSKNPFTSGLNIEKPKFSKEEYGRYIKCSKDLSLQKCFILLI